MRSTMAAAVFTLLLATTAQAEDRKPWTEIDTPELEKAIRSGEAFVVDNNPKFVWEERRIPGAVWMAAKKFAASELPADKGHMLVFYCMNDH
jgi:rhodanese-related sulfurtransferase